MPPGERRVGRERRSQGREAARVPCDGGRPPAGSDAGQRDAPDDHRPHAAR